jgi:nucleoside-diphosphate-sugar epimerase
MGRDDPPPTCAPDPRLALPSARGSIRIETTTTNDPRSYHVSSKKIAAKLGYKPQRTIEDAVRDLCRAFREGKLPNSMSDENYINVKAVKKANLK